MTKRSAVMDDFYGQEISKKIFDRLTFIDSQFNEEIQNIAYEHYWAMPGLSLKEKSIVALTCLIALKKEEQAKLQFMGFLNAGGTADEALDLLTHLGKELNDQVRVNGYTALKDALIEKDSNQAFLTEVDAKFYALLKNPMPKAVLAKSFVDLMRMTLATVSEDPLRMENTFSSYILHDIEQMEVIRRVLIQTIVYCGFPTAMNGFKALRKALMST